MGAPQQEFAGGIQGDVDALVCYVDELSAQHAARRWEGERRALDAQLAAVSMCMRYVRVMRRCAGRCVPPDC